MLGDVAATLALELGAEAPAHRAASLSQDVKLGIQRAMSNQDVNAPTHNGPRPGYSKEVQAEIDQIKLDLRTEGLKPGIDGYARRANELIRTLEEKMRARLTGRAERQMRALRADASLVAPTEASERTMDTRFWLMGEDAYAADYRRGAIWVDSENRIVNSKELKRALFELKQTRSVKITGDVRLPEGFLRPVLSLPPVDFAPDYFTMESEVFVSRRFREALAQPDDVVQYWPVDIIRASDEAHEQDYKFFRVLAWQEAMDFERSVYERSDSHNRRTGEKFVCIEYVKRFVPRADLVPRSEIFRSAESSIFVLVVDGLAERVMRAGCEGVSFDEPETIGMWGREPQRFRTADGIVIVDP